MQCGKQATLENRGSRTPFSIHAICKKKTAIVQSSVNGTPIKAKVHSQTRAVVNKKTYICQAEGSGKEEHIEQLAVA